MKHRRMQGSIVLRSALAIAVGSFALAGAIVPAMAGPDGRQAQPAAKATINTFKSWDGKLSSAGISCGGTTNAGQLIEVPDGMTSLDKFSLWTDGSLSGSLVMRTEVYAWNGTMATGSSLYESAPEMFSGEGPKYEKQTYVTGGIPVVAGAQYLIFATLDKDYEQCVGPYGLRLAAVPGDVYPDGEERYLRSFGDESEWTTHKWPVDKANYDLAVKVYLS